MEKLSIMLSFPNVQSDMTDSISIAEKKITIYKKTIQEMETSTKKLKEENKNLKASLNEARDSQNGSKALLTQTLQEKEALQKDIDKLKQEMSKIKDAKFDITWWQQ